MKSSQPPKTNLSCSDDRRAENFPTESKILPTEVLIGIIFPNPEEVAFGAKVIK